jgi:hypothetical protein
LTFDSLLIFRILILMIGLTAFYRLWISPYWVKKALAWLVFQTAIVGLWLSSIYRYHHLLNPLPLVVAFLVTLFSIGILAIMLIFAEGVLRRQGSSETEKKVSL